MSIPDFFIVEHYHAKHHAVNNVCKLQNDILCSIPADTPAQHLGDLRWGSTLVHQHGDTARPTRYEKMLINTNIEIGERFICTLLQPLYTSRAVLVLI